MLRVIFYFQIDNWQLLTFFYDGKIFTYLLYLCFISTETYLIYPLHLYDIHVRADYYFPHVRPYCINIKYVTKNSFYKNLPPRRVGTKNKKKRQTSIPTSTPSFTTRQYWVFFVVRNVRSVGIVCIERIRYEIKVSYIYTFREF